MAFTPVIDVVYPRIMPPDTIARIAEVSENFIFGSLYPPEAQLLINNQPVAPHSNGAFLAWLPVDWKNRKYYLSAWVGKDSAFCVVRFAKPPEKKPPVQPSVQFPVQVVLNPGALRTDPQGAYYLFADSGTSATAWDWKEGFWKITLTPGRFAWAPHSAVKNPVKLSSLELPAVWKLETADSGKWINIILPLEKRVPFKMTEDAELTRLTCDLFGVVSHLDQMSFPPGTGLIRQLTWDQPGEGWLRLEAALDKPCWGFKAGFSDDQFIISIRKPPRLKSRTETLTIALDAGHGGEQEGALGPTRLKEKDVNLQCVLALRKLLLKKGFCVLMVREDDTTVPLNYRTSLAGEADLLLSIHHNALPDGVNPFENWGVGVRFYHPHSRALAEAVQAALVKELKLFDEGVYYHNLALARPTALPAILIEAGYIMLPEQELRMRQEDYPDRVAGAIYAGLKRFLNEYEVSQP